MTLTIQSEPIQGDSHGSHTSGNPPKVFWSVGPVGWEGPWVTGTALTHASAWRRVKRWGERAERHRADECGGDCAFCRAFAGGVP